MAHVFVETRRTACQMIANGFAALYRLGRLNLEDVTRRTPFALRVGESLGEIGAGEIEELMFALEDPTFFSPSRHYEARR